LYEELRTVADWLDLDELKVSRRGGFARALADHARNQIR